MSRIGPDLLRTFVLGSLGKGQCHPDWAWQLEVRSIVLVLLLLDRCL